MSKEKADIWMPVYIGEYLADTMHLTTEQHGAYMLLLFAYWRIGPLPDDDEALAAITKLPLERWIKTRGFILAFFSVSGGFLNHKRVEAEKARAEAFRERQKANGSKGGRPKKTPETQTKPKQNPGTNPNHNPDESPSPSPSQLNISPDGDIYAQQGGHGGGKGKSGELTLQQVIEQTGADQQAVRDWMATRKKKRAAMTQSAVDLLKREASKAGMTPAQAVLIAAENSWQGFKAEWWQNKQQGSTNTNTRRTANDQRAATIAALTGSAANHVDHGASIIDIKPAASSLD